MSNEAVERHDARGARPHQDAGQQRRQRSGHAVVRARRAHGDPHDRHRREQARKRKNRVHVPDEHGSARSDHEVVRHGKGQHHQRGRRPRHRQPRASNQRRSEHRRAESVPERAGQMVGPAVPQISAVPAEEMDLHAAEFAQKQSRVDDRERCAGEKAGGDPATGQEGQRDRPQRAMRLRARLLQNPDEQRQGDEDRVVFRRSSEATEHSGTEDVHPMCAIDVVGDDRPERERRHERRRNVGDAEMRVAHVQERGRQQRRCDRGGAHVEEAAGRLEQHGHRGSVGGSGCRGVRARRVDLPRPRRGRARGGARRRRGGDGVTRHVPGRLGT